MRFLQDNMQNYEQKGGDINGKKQEVFKVGSG